MPTTTARNYYEQYTGEDAVALLHSLPAANPKIFETEWLDFKSGKAVIDPTSLEKLWSKAVGAFANNEGGVVIFGIDARPDPTTGIDAANAVELVPDVNRLVSKLTELSRFATDPPPTGVEYKPLPLNDSTPEGFVVCLIPEGQIKPYRSEKADRRFYLRMGDSAKEPTVALLRQLFNPQLVTKAELRITYSKKRGEFNDLAVFSCCLINTGTTSIDSSAIGVNGDGMAISFAEGQRIVLTEIIDSIDTLLHPSMSHCFSIFAVLPSWTQQSIIFNFYQQHQEMKSAKFQFDFVQGRFIRDGMCYFKELVLNF